MSTRKQRRRREKLQRHEYEYVIETEEGEVPVEPARRPGEGSKSALSARSGGRTVPVPSLQRVLKRLAIMGPLLLILVFATSGDLSTKGKVVNVLLLLAIFVPFSYAVDIAVYRMFLRRQRRSQGRSS